MRNAQTAAAQRQLDTRIAASPRTIQSRQQRLARFTRPQEGGEAPTHLGADWPARSLHREFSLLALEEADAQNTSHLYGQARDYRAELEAALSRVL